MNAKDDWKDHRFADLEAEVEIEVPRNRWSRKQAEARRKLRLPSLTEALERSQENLILLEGVPGSGKSVALRHLTEKLAEEVKDHPSDQSVVPIYINLREFRRKEPGAQISTGHVRDYVLKSLNPGEDREVDRFLEKEGEFSRGLEAGLWLFLFDSFDEIPDILAATEANEVIDEYAEALAHFLRGIGACRGVIASREFRGPGRLGWPRFEVLPLNREKKLEVVAKAGLSETSEKLLQEEVSSSASPLFQLADNPMFLSLSCEFVREHGEPPATAHDVLEDFVSTRLVSDSERIERRFAVDTDTVRKVAEECAYAMLMDSSLGLTATPESLTEIVAPRLRLGEEEVQAAVDALTYSKLFKSTATDYITGGRPKAEVTFSHRRLQEYFATCIAIREIDRIGVSSILTDGRWRETAVTLLQTQDDPSLEPLLAALHEQFCAAIPQQEEALESGFRWPPGKLHLMDIVSTGLNAGERPSEAPLRLAIGDLLQTAWNEGGSLDKKWALELATAGGPEFGLELLKLGFSNGSLWLRNEAYNQVRRIKQGSERLESEIKQVLLDMAPTGELYRKRRTVETQLLRIANPAQLLRSMRILLLTPAAALLAALLPTILLFLITRDRPLITLGGSLLGVACLVAGFYSFRASRASVGRASHFASGRLGNLGLQGWELRLILIMLSAGLGIAWLLVALDVTSEAFRSPYSWAPILVAVMLWAVAWPFAAVWLIDSGHRFRHPLLWAYLPAEALRRLLMRTSRGVAAMGLFWILALAAFNYWHEAILEFLDRFFSSWMLLVLNIPGACFIAFVIYGGVKRTLLVQRDKKRLWKMPTTALVTSSDLHAALQSIRTERGLLELFAALRTNRNTTPDAIEVLADYDRFLQSRSSSNDFTGAVRLSSASDAADELGRLLEDSSRAKAFTPPASATFPEAAHGVTEQR